MVNCHIIFFYLISVLRPEAADRSFCQGSDGGWRFEEFLTPVLEFAVYVAGFQVVFYPGVCLIGVVFIGHLDNSGG